MTNHSENLKVSRFCRNTKKSPKTSMVDPGPSSEFSYAFLSFGPYQMLLLAYEWMSLTLTTW